MTLINSPDNGATEIPGTSNDDSLFVFLAGPIRHWWTPGVEGSNIHQLYLYQRDFIHKVLSDDYLVYAPHRAWRGPWNSVAQKVNDLSVLTCHAFVWLRVDDVLAHGTDEELYLANQAGKPCFMIEIGHKYSVANQLYDLKDKLDVLAAERKTWA